MDFGQAFCEAKKIVRRLRHLPQAKMENAPFSRVPVDYRPEGLESSKNVLFLIDHKPM